MKIRDLDQNEKKIEFLENWVKNPYGFLIFQGGPGTGKTFTAKTVYETVTPYKLPFYDSDLAVFITQSDLFNQWKSETFNDGHHTGLLKTMSNTRLLILDDLGIRIPTDPFLDFLYSVMDKRFDHRDHLGTIITTNFKSSELCEMFGYPFASRTLSGQLFKFEGDDRRFRK